MARLRGSREQTDVLVVCTGNICRSPYIAEMLRSRSLNLFISSAGTHANVGGPTDERVLSELDRRGIQTLPAPPIQASKGLIRDSRLIITATRAHRVAVVELDPRSAERTFTLKEIARILQKHSHVVGLDAVINIANWAAHQPDPFDHDDDLDDPHGGEEAVYLRMFDEVDAALETIIPALGVHL